MIQKSHPYFSQKALETMLTTIRADGPTSTEYVKNDCFQNVDVCKRDIMFSMQYMREHAKGLGIAFFTSEEGETVELI